MASQCIVFLRFQLYFGCCFQNLMLSQHFGFAGSVDLDNGLLFRHQQNFECYSLSVGDMALDND